MPVTIDEVRGKLLPEEPDYEEAAASLGPEALPLLEEIIRGDDRMLAAKAASLVGVIAAEDSPRILQEAAQSADPLIRVAVAVSARHLAEPSASEVLLTLVSDADPGVRKTAVTSVGPEATADLQARVRELAATDEDDVVRQISSDVVRQFTA